MNDSYDDDETLEALALGDEEFDAEIRTLIREGLNDGDIGYRQWWNMAHNLKMAKMDLVICRKAIERIKEDQHCLLTIYSILDSWPANAKERAEKWMSLLEAEDWNTILAMNSEGLLLRRLSPLRFSLPETECDEIVRKYYR